MGLDAAAAAAAARSISAGVGARPSSRASASLARSTTGATAPSAMRAFVQTPPAAESVTATPVTVIASPLRRASL